MSLAGAGLRPRRSRRVGGIDRDFGYDSQNTGGLLDYKSFPSTPMLDTFSDGASQLLTARPQWTSGNFINTEVSCATDSVPTYASQPTGTTTGGNVANVGTLTDCEAWCYIEALGDSLSPIVRGVTGGPSFTGYQLSVALGGPGTGTVTISAVGQPIPSSRGAVTGMTFSAGDGLGIRAVGPQLTAWWQTGGGPWQMIISGADYNYTSGNIGFRIGATTTSAKMSSFGGGAINTAGTEKPVVVRRTWAGR